MLYILIFIYFLYTSYKIFLSVIEINFVRKKSKETPVVLFAIDYKKAANNAITNEKFSLFSSIYSFVILIFWVSWGAGFLEKLVSPHEEIITNLLFVMSFIFLNSLLGLPLDIYSKFVKDKKLGFSNITPMLFVIDTIKSMLLLLVFGSLLVFVVLAFIKYAGELWWIYAFIFLFGVVVIINLIYPTLIAPIFNKMSPLDNEDLKESINSLLLRAGFKSSGIFIIDASKRDKRLNAYFGGFGSSKRVVLFDTLVSSLKQSELLAVLGHELGHYKHNDIIKNIILMFFVLLVVFFILGNLPQSFFLALNLRPDGAALIVFSLLFLPVINAFFEPIISTISRSHEFDADNYAAFLQNKDDLKNALIKLSEKNLVFPISHPLYATIYHSHPTLLERIKELE